MPTPADPLAPGADGSPVPDGVRLIRLATEPTLARFSPEAVRRVVQDGRALPEFFELSTADKSQPVPRLSVWVDGLTTVAQAWTLTGAAPDRRVLAWLDATAVRQLRPDPADPPHPGLEVVWERATRLVSEVRVPDGRPGADGHAGIERLDAGTKTQRKSLRFKLADAATVRVLGEDEISGWVGSTSS